MYLKDKGIFDDDGFSAEDICIEEIQPAFSEEGSADLFFGFKNESAHAYFDDIYDTGWDEEDVWERLLIRYNPATGEKTAYEWWDTPNDTDAFEIQLTDKEWAVIDARLELFREDINDVISKKECREM